MILKTRSWDNIRNKLKYLKKDAETGNYNPVALRFGLTDGQWTPESRSEFAGSVDHSVRMIATAYELWDFGVWSSIIQSTVYEGLFCVGKAVLEGTFQTSGKRKAIAGRSKEHVWPTLIKFWTFPAPPRMRRSKKHMHTFWNKMECAHKAANFLPS